MRISNNIISNRADQKINDILNQINKKSNQVSSLKKAEQYSNIERFETKTIKSEININKLNRDVQLIQLEKSRLEAMNAAVETLIEPMRSIDNMLSNIVSMGPNNSTNQTYVEKLFNLQNYTYAFLMGSKGNLNEMFNSTFLFGGDASRQAPVKLLGETLPELQSIYDGFYNIAPRNEAANLYDISINKANLELKSHDARKNINKITDTDAANKAQGIFINRNLSNKQRLTWSSVHNKKNNLDIGQISLSHGQEFKDMKSGTTLLISSSIKENSGVYKVLNISTDGKHAYILPAPKGNKPGSILMEGSGTYNISVGIPETTLLTLSNANINNGNYNTEYIGNGFYEKLNDDEKQDFLRGKCIFVKGKNMEYSQAQNVRISSNSYYKGNSVSHEYKIQNQHYIKLGINAQHPTIEKSIRIANILLQKLPYRFDGSIDGKKTYEVFKEALAIVKTINQDGFMVLGEKSDSLNKLNKNLAFQTMQLETTQKVSTSKIHKNEISFEKAIKTDLVKSQMELKRLKSMLEHSLKTSNKIISLSNGEFK